MAGINIGMERGHSYIRLITAKPLTSDEIKDWISIVDRIGPKGVHGNAIITVNGQRKDSDSYVRDTKAGIEHVVPLTRDLTVDEAGKISIAWDRVWSGGDFEVDFSQAKQSQARKIEEKTIVVDAICEEMAKLMHNEWIKGKVSHHWNYGPRYSRTQKTHPNLLPWEQLPRRQRIEEIKRVKRMVDVLQSMNLRLAHV